MVAVYGKEKLCGLSVETHNLFLLRCHFSKASTDGAIYLDRLPPKILGSESSVSPTRNDTLSQTHKPLSAKTPLFKFIVDAEKSLLNPFVWAVQPFFSAGGSLRDRSGGCPKLLRSLPWPFLKPRLWPRSTPNANRQSAEPRGPSPQISLKVQKGRPHMYI